jgi:tetratricopeptide (TPR) repeat protein
MASRRARALAAFVLCAAAAACGDESTTKRAVSPLEPRSAGEAEAAEQFAAAQAFLDAGDDRLAEPVLRRVLDQAPKHAKALAALGDLCFRRRSFEEAVQLLARYVELEPDDFDHRRRLFEAYCGKRDFVGAETAARAWVAHDRDFGEPWYALGCAQHELGKLDAAVKSLEAAGARQSSRGDVRSRLGLVLLAQGKHAAAEAAQRDALQRDPRYVPAWSRLGDLIALAGASRRSEAITAYRRGAQASGSGAVHARLYRQLRLASAADASRAEEADAEWKTLVAVLGRDMLPFAGLPAPTGEAPDPDREEKALRAAVVASPDDALARARYATCLHRRGDVSRAVEEYAEASRAAPSDASIRAAYGAALLAKGDAGAAVVELSEATKLGRADGTTSRNLGWALLLLGRDADAVLAFDRALALSADDRLSRRARGIARMHAGDLDGGLKDVVDSGWSGP